MRKSFVLCLALIFLAPTFSLAQIKDQGKVKDDIEAVASLFRTAASPLDLIGTPLFNLWAEFLTFPARGADLAQYQDKYYYDYDTLTRRQSDAIKPPGRYPVGEYEAPRQSPRETRDIMYLPPLR